MKIKRDELTEALFSLHDQCINPYSREIYLGSWDGNTEEEPGVDYRMALQFIKNISFLERQSKEPILIHQCTVGGEWEYGMAIYDAIKNCSCYVTMLCYGHSRSMSSITLQAADRRILTPNCVFMVHHGTITIDDTVLGVESYVETAKAEKEQMMNIYAERCNLTAEQILDKIGKAQDWYMQSTEAVKHGFADEIYNGDVEAIL